MEGEGSSSLTLKGDQIAQRLCACTACKARQCDHNCPVFFGYQGAVSKKDLHNSVQPLKYPGLPFCKRKSNNYRIQFQRRPVGHSTSIPGASTR